MIDFLIVFMSLYMFFPVGPMSGFELIPVHGGDAIHLPPGESIVGRGPFLRVNDKRVSRHHGLLNNQDGRLRLKPTHLNPCFLQSSPADDPRPLQKDVWCPLDHGDIFSLLPGQLMFRVAEVGGRTLISPLRVSATCEGYANPVSRQRTPPTSPGCHGAKPEASNQEASLAGEALTEDDKVGRNAVVAPSPRKKRLLPTWMMAAVNSSSATLSRQVAKKSRQTELSDDKKTEVQKIRKGDGCADVASSHEDLANVEEDNNQLQDDDSVTMEMEQEGQDHGEATTRKCDVTTRKCDIIPSSQQNTSAKAKEKDKSPYRLRTACPYGKDCYSILPVPLTSWPLRKNPLHFKECSHPGDSDYEEEEEEERPECPYGIDCYRKNPLHRKQYNHTKNAARSRRAATKAKAASGVDSDSDSGDGFINDDSDNVDADSDYAPPPDSD
ncbi:aprataxin and PNK-like factor isoform X2 [Phycodurus eques]|uniref:aprataxin and PNK-like factor isoform X2 n=1 Tax=Phycodurus eques TaxID=693459 RepID=UPI002ACED6B1|nr:aprataxin and PNK-like factor isoform X2 [Phycodurus eques]